MLTRRHFGIVAAGALSHAAAAAEKEALVYIGTYTRGGSKGIYAYRFDTGSGKLTDIGLAAETDNPSFLHVTENGRRLYCVGEGKTGSVSAFNVDRSTGKLSPINKQISGGDGPCHLTIDNSGRNLLIAHYGSGSVASFRLNGDGSIGERTELIQHSGPSTGKGDQTGPHAHSVVMSKNGKYVVVGELGLDQYLVYALNPSRGTLMRHSVATVKPGSGPRHFSFHPGYKLAYGVNELNSTVTAFQWNESTGNLTEIHTVSTLPGDFKGSNDCAEILVHPTGKYVYASNRGHDSIAIFSVAPDGKLTFMGAESTQGKTPRNFRIDPSGSWLIAANQQTGNLVVFRLDKASGKLTATGEQAKLSSPVCVKFIV